MPATVNLDAMDYADLVAYVKAYGDAPESDIPAEMAAYAAMRAGAIRARLDGRIADALGYEKRADIVYDAIPEAYRW